MADCRFCGKPAGILRHEHAECRARHDKAEAEICASFVDALKNNVEPMALRQLVESDAAQNFIGETERKLITVLGFAKMIVAAGGNYIGQDDSSRIIAIQKAFNLSNDDLGAAGQELTKSRILLALDAGQIEKVKTSFSGPFAPRLETEEHGIWAFSGVKYLVVKHETQYVGRSSGVSIRLMKGLYYRTGSYKTTPIHSGSLNLEDTGGLSLTNHNLYFVGSHVAVKIPLKKIVSAQLYSDGLEILQSGTSKKPLTLQFSDAEYAANLLARLHGD